MTSEPAAQQDLTTRALEWLVAQTSGTWTEADRLAFNAWLAESNEHQQQFQKAALLWIKMDMLKEHDFPQREAALRYRPQSTEKVLPFKRKRLSSLGVLFGHAIAACVLLIITSAQLYLTLGSQQIETGKGEQKTIALADGSQIKLNTDTKLLLKPELFGHQRVRLYQGEALFTINHQTNRQFEVICEHVQIHDIGTLFNVYTDSDRYEIAVLDGEVALSTDEDQTIKLESGQMATFTTNGQLVTNALNNPESTIAWQDGRLIFADQPFPQVLAELSRYHEVTFIIDDPKLQNLKISGTFKSANLPLLLKTLEAGFPLSINAADKQHIHFFAATNKR